MAKAWKVITPKRLQPDAFRLEILNELRKVEKLMRKDFEATTKTWEHKPEFESAVHLPQGSPAVEVTTDDKVYGYVTYGTKPHIIKAKTSKGLWFREGYQAKTQPRVIGSGPGGPFGAYVIPPPQVVHHPGNEAREFHETIEEKWVSLFEQHMKDALDRGAKKCGHGIP